MSTQREMLAVLRDVAALLPAASRLHPQDLHDLQTRVCAAVAKADVEQRRPSADAWFAEQDRHGEWRVLDENRLTFCRCGDRRDDAETIARDHNESGAFIRVLRDALTYLEACAAEVAAAGETDDSAAIARDIRVVIAEEACAHDCDRVDGECMRCGEEVRS